MKKELLARFISVIFNPVLFFFLMPYIIVFRQTASVPSAIKWAVFSSLFTIIAVTLLLIGRLKGVFSDKDLSVKEEREEFYLIALALAFSYLMISIFFKGLFFHLSIVSLGIFLGIIVFSFINLYLKASIHMAVSCAFIVSILIFYGTDAFISLLWVIPIVAWARLKLKKHTPREIIAGTALGIAITLLTFIMARQIL